MNIYKSRETTKEMPKKVEKVAIHPCGVCKIGVKYAAILCTGSCNLWFHGECVGMPYKTIKKLTKDEISIWTCKSCKQKLKPTETPCKIQLQKEDTFQAIGEAQSFSIPTSVTPETANCQKDSKTRPSLNDLERSLLEHNHTNDEDKLELAGQLGSALLAENNCLKEKMHRLEASLYTKETKIEELEEVENSLTKQIFDLGNRHEETLMQLEKEKHLKQELQEFYEENDKQLNLTIDEYAKTIYEQDKLIHSLKNKLSVLGDKENESTKLQQDSQTQTQFPDQATENHSSYLLMQITRLKLSQNQVEQQLKVLQEQIQLKQISEPIPPIALTQNTPNSKMQRKKKEIGLKKNHFSVSLQMNTLKNSSITGGDRQTPTEKLHLNLKKDESIPDDQNLETGGDRQTPTKKLSKDDFATKHETREGNLLTQRPLRRKTCISTSLRYSKYKAKNTPNEMNHEIPVLRANHTKMNPPKPETALQYTSKFKVTKAPPITATKLTPLETFQDFFDKHIEEAKAEQYRNYTTKRQVRQSDLNEEGSTDNNTSFLWNRQPKLTIAEEYPSHANL